LRTKGNEIKWKVRREEDERNKLKLNHRKQLKRKKKER
jgi:hypothetical protein